MARTMSSQLIIKSPRPGRTALVSFFSVAIVAGLAYGTYYYGHSTAGFNHNRLASEQEQLKLQLFEVGQANTELREKNAELEQAVNIDKKAYKSVDASLKVLQKEILELKEQVTFYRGIVSPESTASGLNITSFKLNKLAGTEDAGYHFKLVLTQVRQNTKMIRGNASILIDGLHNGEPKQINVSKLSSKSKLDMKLRFKYFQTIEGDVVLPDGFVPSSVLVNLKPKGRGQNAIKQTFNWMEITSG